jgi:hypothetical protein
MKQMFKSLHSSFVVENCPDNSFSAGRVRLCAIERSMQHAPDLSTVCDALSILQTEAKASSDNATQMLDAVKHELKNELKNTADTVNAIAANVRSNMRAGEDAKTAAKEAVEVGKANLQMARQIKNAGP